MTCVIIGDSDCKPTYESFMKHHESQYQKLRLNSQNQLSEPKRKKKQDKIICDVGRMVMEFGHYLNTEKYHLIVSCALSESKILGNFAAKRTYLAS